MAVEELFAHRLRAARVRFVFYVAAVALTMAWVLVAGPFPPRPYLDFRSLEFGLLGGLFTSLGLAVYHRLLIRPSKPDDALTRRMRDMAASVGVRVPEVRAVESGFGQRHATAWTTRLGAILVSRRLLEMFSGEELDFVLAHELMHLRWSGVRTTIALGLTAMFTQVLIITAMVFGFEVRDAGTAFLAFGVVSLALLLTIYEISRLERQQEHEADLGAVKLTGNPGAAISALEKMLLHAHDPSSQENEFISGHPKASRRIEIIRGEWGAASAE